MAKKKTEPPVPEEKLYTTLAGEGHAELIERKSQFLGHAAPVKTEEEALAFIAKIKHEYADATHNVFAYMLEKNSIARYSDDGEPQGTAGIPVLDVIKKSGFIDAVIVVTRYFGGILLGAGGLVRAYSAAARDAVAAAKIVTYELYAEIKVECTYSDYQKLENEFPRYGIIVDGTDFGVGVTLNLAIKMKTLDEYALRLSEMSAGRLKPEKTGERYDFK